MWNYGGGRQADKQQRQNVWGNQLQQYGSQDQQYQKFMGLDDSQKNGFLFNGGAVNPMQQKQIYNRWMGDLQSQGKNPNEWINSTTQNGGMNSQGWNIFNKPNNSNAWGSNQQQGPMQGGWMQPNNSQTGYGQMPSNSSWKGFDNQGNDAPWGSPNAVQGLGGLYSPSQPSNPVSDSNFSGVPRQGGYNNSEQIAQDRYNSMGSDPGLAAFRAGGLNGNFGGVSAGLHALSQQYMNPSSGALPQLGSGMLQNQPTDRRYITDGASAQGGGRIYRGQ